MARKIIETGIVGNDGTGDSIRESFTKVNDNFRELYSSLGLGERLKFINLIDVGPTSYEGWHNSITGATPVVTVNALTTGLEFKYITAGNGIDLDYSSSSAIKISSQFSSISADKNPALGGNLTAKKSGGTQYRILELPTPTADGEAVNKAYADTKVSKGGATLTGPLILARDPTDADIDIYHGLAAATQNYVNNSGFSSVSNLFVAMSGSDSKPGVSKVSQGRSLATAFRTIEAALKRAEEIQRESRLDIGPYKKVLTYGNHLHECALSNIISSAELSGTGFAGTALMSVDSVSIVSPGSLYQIGEILTFVGGTYTYPASIQVIGINLHPDSTSRGTISSFRILNSGVYSVLPPAITSVTTNLAGQTATFSLKYKVNNVHIGAGQGGSDYSLVSVRIDGGVTSAFGTAHVALGAITGISITDPGSGFTSIPIVKADVPRFLIYTAGSNTDYTGNVSPGATTTEIRKRDIREGLYLKGETSGAIAQIISHSGQLLDINGLTVGPTDYEVFDVDIKFGQFIVNEKISYGDVTNTNQVSVRIESGLYEENYPLRVPQNVAIIGDEFRRVIIRPKPGYSTSPWAFQYFRRDLTIDSLTTASQLYGYHYLTDSTEVPFRFSDNSLVSNKGAYSSASHLLQLNKLFMQEEIVAMLNKDIANPSSVAYTTYPNYDPTVYKSNIGAIIDAIAFDLQYSRFDRTLSEAYKFHQLASGINLITTQLSQTVAYMEYIKTLAVSILSNTKITALQATEIQFVENSYVTELDAPVVFNQLVDMIISVISADIETLNHPKLNNEMDVFLCNDAVIVRAVSCQGHGGFMMVFDPEGQVLTKSPYAQECGSFSRSQNEQVFAGGQFADGFAGNLEFVIDSKFIDALGATSNYRLNVSGLSRVPNLPCSFIVEDQRYRVNYFRNFEYDVNGSSAQLVLDDTTPWTKPVFTYNSSYCSRDIGYILNGVGYDVVLGTNFNARRAGTSYRQISSKVVIDSQKLITTRAIGQAITDGAVSVAQIISASSASSGIKTQQLTLIAAELVTITNIVTYGVKRAATLVLPNPTTMTTAQRNAKALLVSNFKFLRDEVIGYITAGVGASPAGLGFTNFDSTVCDRDLLYILEALAYDFTYGGNSQTVISGVKYYAGVGTKILQIASLEQSATYQAITYLGTIIQRVIQNLAPVSSYSSTPRVTGTAATATEATTLNNLLSPIISTVRSTTAPTVTEVNSKLTTVSIAYPSVGSPTVVTVTYPTLTTANYTQANIDLKSTIDANALAIRSAVINWIDVNGNRYELLMPGNRSMLANDFTQVNDLGYGIIATNGGLIEAVSMFTYYNHISYYSLNGGQIRSVSGSSANGNYALVAEGSDPLEVPTPTSIYGELAQRVDCYYPSAKYENKTDGSFIYVYNYHTLPFSSSELEIDHGNVIKSYPVSSVSTTGLPAGVARLDFTSSIGSAAGAGTGLLLAVPADTKMTLRCNSTLMLTGGLQDVAVRPSTGLQLFNTSEVYRVLQFDASSDINGPFPLTVTTGAPGTLKATVTITAIATNVCTTSTVHNLCVNDIFKPTSTANGFTANATYYVTSVVSYTSFKVSTTIGGTTSTLTNGTGLTIVGVKSHRLSENLTIRFEATTLPTGISATTTYFVSPDGLTDTTFRISETQNGTTVALTTTGTGLTYTPFGLTYTTLRENYNYIELNVAQPGEIIASTSKTVTVSLASTSVFTATGHGFLTNDVVRVTAAVAPTGVSLVVVYFVTFINANTFHLRSSYTDLTSEITATSTGTSVVVSKIYGRGADSPGAPTGDTSFAIVPISPADTLRIIGSKFVFKGEEYVVTQYDSTVITNSDYARVTIDRPLVNSILAYSSSYTAKAGVAYLSQSSAGTLTIRISLTRVTGHDLLDIGTGSYADTNYPGEIYGAPANPLDQSKETEERNVGRCFYVTTDQWGNFNVGPYFTVDQGTGHVKLAASISLSNVDGLGFKKGSTVSEFSVDSSMADNATDTVPTENATRIYIERRLGVTHAGTVVADDQLIPMNTGGFLPLNGLLKMKGNIDLASPGGLATYRVVNSADPVAATDLVNKQSLLFSNMSEITFTSPTDMQLPVFTGESTTGRLINASLAGDISFARSSGTITTAIKDSKIFNSMVSPVAAIDQTKLNLDNSYASVSSVTITNIARDVTGLVTLTYATLLAAPFSTTTRIVVSGVTPSGFNGTFTVLSCNTTTITYNSGATTVVASTAVTGVTVVPMKGIAAFNTSNFTVVNGYVSIKANGSALNSLSQIATTTVLGNSTAGTGDVTAVPFSTVCSAGGAILKSQYTRKTMIRSTDTEAQGFAAVLWSDSTVYNSATDNGAVVTRTSTGDISANTGNLVKLQIQTKDALASSYTSLNGNAYIQLTAYHANNGAIVLNSNDTDDTSSSIVYKSTKHDFKTNDGSSFAPINAGTITTTAITTGAEATIGYITGDWKLTGKFESTYAADLAEYYEGDKVYEVGTVLVFGGDCEVTISSKLNDSRVAGVVSNTAAYAMYSDCPGDKNLIALQGRVPCKVVGKVSKGDLLVTSSIRGVAIAAQGTVLVGTVIGKALQTYESDHIGLIEISVGRT